MTATDRPLRAAVTAGLAVPPSPHPDITLSRPTAEVLRVRYRGWVAEVRGATVVVPQQNCPRGADPTDLITCLAVAASFRAGAHCVDPGASSPAAPVASSPSSSTTSTLRGLKPLVTQVRRILGACPLLGLWHPFPFTRRHRFTTFTRLPVAAIPKPPPTYIVSGASA